MLNWWHVRLVIEFGIAREAVSEDVKQALGAASIGILTLILSVMMSHSMVWGRRVISV